jgi:hypothetical protein
MMILLAVEGLGRNLRILFLFADWTRPSTSSVEFSNINSDLSNQQVRIIQYYPYIYTYTYIYNITYITGDMAHI